MDDFHSEIDTKVDSLSLELCSFDELDNPLSIATQSSLLESKASNEKRSLRGSDKAATKMTSKNIYMLFKIIFLKTLFPTVYS